MNHSSKVSIAPALVVLVATLFVNHVAFAGEVHLSIPVAEDASVNSLNPDGNLNTLTTRGGLFSGSDNFGSDYQFYLKFHLPKPAAGEVLKAANLIGTYTNKYDNTDSLHQLSFVADDSWSESTITFNNRPAAVLPTGAMFNAFTAKIGAPDV